MSLRILTIALLIFGHAGAISAQTSNVAPVEWKNFRLEGQNASVRMPKMPVRFNFDQPCDGMLVDKYAAYAQGAVYIVTVASKTSPDRKCPKWREFDVGFFDSRIGQVLSQPGSLAETPVSKTDDRRFRDLNTEFRFLRDKKGERWFELQAIGRRDETVWKSFIESLAIEAASDAADVGFGAFETLGDYVEPKVAAPQPTPAPTPPTVKTPGIGSGNGNGVGNGDGNGKSELNDKPQLGDVKIDVVSEPVKVVLYHRANYTDEARKQNIQGVVRLRVTFLANGSVGSVSVISGLEGGLVEQAMIAAKRLVFIPAHRGGVPYSVTKPVEYSFAIY